ncbi:unnamed protein product, partial [Discosporangium mesarthrocarpum]
LIPSTTLPPPSTYISLVKRSEAGRGIGGVAYGGYARKVVGRVLDGLPQGSNRVEDHPSVLFEALAEARRLVG